MDSGEFCEVSALKQFLERLRGETFVVIWLSLRPAWVIRYLGQVHLRW